MSSTAQQLLNDALALPDNERLQLVEALIASLQPADQPPFDEPWRPLVRKRSAELLSGQVVPIPWDEVKESIRHDGF